MRREFCRRSPRAPVFCSLSELAPVTVDRPVLPPLGGEGVIAMITDLNLSCVLVPDLPLVEEVRSDADATCSRLHVSGSG